MSTIIRLPRKSGARAPSSISGINWASPLAQGLISCWPLFGPYAQTKKELVYGFDAAKAGGGSLVDDVIAHRNIGRVLDFTLNGYLSTVANSIHEVQSHTVALTMRPDEINASGSLIFGKMDNVAAGGFEWALRTANGFRFAYYGTAIRGWYDVAYTPTIGNTIDVVLRFDDGPNEISAWVDGTKLGTTSTSTQAITYNGDTLDIGHGHTNPEWRGVLADVRFYNRALTDDEVQAHFSSQYRWDIYQQGTRTISLPGAAAAATTSTVIRTTKKSGARAPSHVTGINWASPLAEGLIHAVAGGYDSTARDLVTGEAMTLGTGTTRAAGKLGRALDFNGTSNATAKLSTTSFSDASPFTMASWFQLKDNLSNPTSSVSLHHGTDNDRWHVLAWSPGVPAFRFGVRDGGAYYPAVASYSPSAWELISQVGVVHGATDRRQYINGVEDGTVSNSVDVTLNSTTFFNLGTLHRVAQVNGSVLLHAAMVWDQRALSASDVAALYSPKYRWDIFQQGTRTISLPSAAASTGLTTIRRKL